MKHKPGSLASDIAACLLDMRIDDAFDLMTQDRGKDGFTCFVHGILFEAIGEGEKALAAYREMACRTALSAKQQEKVEELKSWLLTYDPRRTHFIVEAGAEELIEASRKAFDNGAHAHALTLASALTDRFPDIVWGWTWNGNLYRRADRLGEALSCYWRSISIRPDQPDVYRAIGQIQHEIGQKEEAIASFTKVLMHEPDDLNTHLTLGGLFLERHQMDLSLNWYRKAVSLKPKSKIARVSLGRAELQNGYWAQAQQHVAARFEKRADEHRFAQSSRWKDIEQKAGSVLVWREQCKLEDEILFLSAIDNLLGQKERDVAIEVNPKIYRLTKASFPSLKIVPFRSFKSMPVSAQHYISSMELFLATGEGKTSDPYFSWEAKLNRNEHFTVGVTKSGLPDSIDLSLELMGLEREIGFVDLDEDEDVSLIERLSSCDLVIGGDGAVLRLCGALGRPAIGLLTVSSSWIWGAWPEDVRPFKCVQTYRQKHNGSWKQLVRQVHRDVQQYHETWKRA